MLGIVEPLRMIDTFCLLNYEQRFVELSGNYARLIKDEEQCWNLCTIYTMCLCVYMRSESCFKQCIEVNPQRDTTKQGKHCLKRPKVQKKMHTHTHMAMNEQQKNRMSQHTVKPHSRVSSLYYCDFKQLFTYHHRDIWVIIQPFRSNHIVRKSVQLTSINCKQAYKQTLIKTPFIWTYVYLPTYFWHVVLVRMFTRFV